MRRKRLSRKKRASNLVPGPAGLPACCTRSSSKSRVPDPAHQTGRADFLAYGFRTKYFMLSPTGGCSSSVPGGLTRVAHEDTHRGRLLFRCVYGATTGVTNTGCGHPLRDRLSRPGQSGQGRPTGEMKTHRDRVNE